jgi:uncharacterized DUF497 family protein
MRISYDRAKREWTLLHRGLDFEDAALVFQGLTVEIEDERKDYGERRSEQARLAPFFEL